MRLQDLCAEMVCDRQTRGMSCQHVFPHVLILSHTSCPRCAEGCRPHRGPMAVGGRLQQTMTPPFPGSSHCKLSAAAAYLTTLPGSGVADAMLPDREGCLGGNLELIADMQPLAGTR